MKNYKIPKFTCRFVREGSFLSAREKVECPNDACAFFADISELPHEEFHVLFLDGESKPIGRTMVSRGGQHGCAILARDILRPALIAGSSVIIVAHNHPSGNPTPSFEDLVMTRSLLAACKAVGLPLLDHMVIARGGSSVSMRERTDLEWP
jgi:DNA repair protein RadC